MTAQDQDDALQSLHQAHSELCAKAAELGVAVPEELHADFDTPEAGRAIVASLKKIVEAKPENSSPAKKAVKRSASVKKTKAPPQQESTVSKTAKKAKAKKAVKKTVKKKVAKRDGTTSAKVIAMLRRKGGATREQILKVTGWKAISVQQVAAGQGVKLKINKDERPFHYMAA